MPWDDTATTERHRVNIFDYHWHKLRWQGSSLDVLYKRIKSDMEAGQYNIVKKAALPEEVAYMENPFTMPVEHVLPWVQHLLKSDAATLPEHRRFQYARPDLKGPVVQGYQTEQACGICLEYGPEVHSYALCMQGLETSQPTSRSDGLPLYYANDSVYRSISFEQQSFWQEKLEDDAEFSALLDALTAHDDAHPLQAPAEFWECVASSMPHLKPELPASEAGIRQFITDKGRLPVAFFDFAHTGYAQWCMHHCLDWCCPDTFIHPLSGTLMGGPYSVKWVVLFLAHLMLNVILIDEDPSTANMHYMAITSRVHITFMETDKHRIYQCHLTQGCTPEKY
ncbi:hypothetical protein RSAG8_13412, partial [Rhizoctonia solani AG-8 WAC10335]